METAAKKKKRKGKKKSKSGGSQVAVKSSEDEHSLFSGDESAPTSQTDATSPPHAPSSLSFPPRFDLKEQALSPPAYLHDLHRSNGIPRPISRKASSNSLEQELRERSDGLGLALKIAPETRVHTAISSQEGRHQEQPTPLSQAPTLNKVEPEENGLANSLQSGLDKEVPSLREQVKQLQSEVQALQGALQQEACLKEEVERLRQEQLIAAVSKAEAQTQIARLCEENANLNNDNARLQEENSKLSNKLEEHRESVERLEAERKQSAAKLAAIQAGMQQLEREASIRSRARSDVDTVATLAEESSKGWLGWVNGKDPVVEAMAVAEEARVQKAAATAMAEKLLAENAALTERVNEQAALIDRLARKYSRLEGGYEVYESEEDKSRAATPRSATTKGLQSEQIDGRRVPRNSGSTLWSGESTGRSLDQIAEAESVSKSGAPEVIEANSGGHADAHPSAMPESSLVKERWKEDSLPSPEADVGSDMPSVEAMGHELSNSSVSVVEQELKGPANDEASLGNAPLTGAPIRLVSWFTRFVSGADLVGK